MKLPRRGERGNGKDGVEASREGERVGRSPAGVWGMLEVIHKAYSAERHYYRPLK